MECFPLYESYCFELLSHVQLFCNPTDCSPSGSSVHGISHERMLEWIPPFPSPGDLPHPGIEPAFPALAGRFFTIWAIADFQCCVNFSCIAKWSSCIYIYKLGASLHCTPAMNQMGYFPPWVYWSLGMNTYIYMYLLIPNSQHIPCPFFPFGNYKFVCEPISIFYIGSFILFFRFHI